MTDYKTIHRRMALWEALEIQGYHEDAIPAAISDAEATGWTPERVGYWLQKTPDSDAVRAIINA